MTEAQERDLINRAKHDISAFDFLYDTYFPKIFKFVMYRVQNRHIAEEIVSNVFFKAMNKLALFKWRSLPFSAWLYRISISEISNYFRKEKKSRKINDALYIEKEIPVEKYQEFSYEFIHVYLQQLSEKNMNIIILRFFEKKSFTEISEIMKIKENTLRVQLHRALKKLESLIPKEVREDVYRKVS